MTIQTTKEGKWRGGGVKGKYVLEYVGDFIRSIKCAKSLLEKMHLEVRLEEGQGSDVTDMLWETVPGKGGSKGERM